jgi:NMD protein affecting ribosome stability and mRNA decay
MSRKRSETHSAARQPRRPRRIHEETPGQAPGKLPEIAGCPDCGASYRNGRWTWKKAPAGSYEHVCPACERVAADYPAGVLHVDGGFAAAHREELVALVRNIEERERAEHPLNRIMTVADESTGFAVTVTDGKLAQTFGRALQSAYQGRLEHPTTTSDTENLVRVRWTRD